MCLVLVPAAYLCDSCVEFEILYVLFPVPEGVVVQITHAATLHAYDITSGNSAWNTILQCLIFELL